MRFKRFTVALPWTCHFIQCDTSFCLWFSKDVIKDEEEVSTESFAENEQDTENYLHVSESALSEIVYSERDAFIEFRETIVSLLCKQLLQHPILLGWLSSYIQNSQKQGSLMEQKMLNMF